MNFDVRLHHEVQSSTQVRLLSTKESFHIIFMHMMNKEKIAGRKRV